MVPVLLLGLNITFNKKVITIFRKYEYEEGALIMANMMPSVGEFVHFPFPNFTAPNYQWDEQKVCDVYHYPCGCADPTREFGNEEGPAMLLMLEGDKEKFDLSNPAVVAEFMKYGWSWGTKALESDLEEEKEEDDQE